MFEKNKILSIAILAVLCISLVAVFSPTAKATGETIIGSISIDDSSYLRCYDYTYEQANDGKTSDECWDVAYLTASIPPGMGSDCPVLATLFKQTIVDGVTIRNGMIIPETQGGTGFTNGLVALNTESFYYYDWMGGSVNFQYDLSWDGIFYGYDQYPNWWSADDFEGDLLGPDEFKNLRWAGHTIEVRFAVYWTLGYPFSMYGATCDFPDAAPTWFDGQPGINSEACTTHTDNGWESWKFMIPSDEIHFACSTAWTETYGSASISNPYEAQYRTPDGSYATFLASSSGSLARAAYWIGGSTTGTIYIYGDSMYSPFSRFLVYASNDNNNWQLASEQLVYNSGDRWINCGNPGITYQYVMVIAYDSGTTSNMKINCINCGGHY